MAIALELAASLSVNRDRLPGLCRFAFQPAEEGAAGQADDRRRGPAGNRPGDRPARLGRTATGQVSVREGAMMASADWFTLTVRGVGGHGAIPDATVDAVVIAAHIVTACRRWSAGRPRRGLRWCDPGSIHGGSASNIIARDVVIQGTLRTFDAGLAAGSSCAASAELAHGVAQAMRGSCECRHEAGAPPVVNEPGDRRPRRRGGARGAGRAGGGAVRAVAGRRRLLLLSE